MLSVRSDEFEETGDKQLVDDQRSLHWLHAGLPALPGLLGLICL